MNSIRGRHRFFRFARFGFPSGIRYNPLRGCSVAARPSLTLSRLGKLVFPQIKTSVPIILLMMFFGCGPSPQPKIVSLPDVTYEPPVMENSIVFSIVKDSEQLPGFAVYSGSSLDSDKLLRATNEAELHRAVDSHITAMVNSNQALDTIIIECGDGVRSGDVELLKSGITQSTAGSSFKLFVGIRQDSDVAEND